MIAGLCVDVCSVWHALFYWPQCMHTFVFTTLCMQTTLNVIPVTWRPHKHPVFCRQGLFLDRSHSSLENCFNADIEGEVTRRMQGMNPLLVIWGGMCHARECYHRHSMGWIPPFSLHRAMTELSFLAGPEGEEEGKGPRRREHKEEGTDWLGAVDKLSE